MIMNNQLSLRTTGVTTEFLDQNKGIRFWKFESRIGERSGHEIHTGILIVGDIDITIYFEDAREISNFCKKHNIEYKNNIDESNDQGDQ